jgi:predicted phosphodiesterase
MRIGIISDVHANIDALGAVLAHGSECKVEQWWFLGDAVGRGPTPCEVVSRLREVVDEKYWLVGNHDLYVIQPLYYTLSRMNEDEPTYLIKEEDKWTIEDHRHKLKGNQSDLWDWCKAFWKIEHTQSKQIEHANFKSVLVHGGLGDSYSNAGLREDGYIFSLELGSTNADIHDQFNKLLDLGNTKPVVLFHGHTHVPHLSIKRKGEQTCLRGPISYKCEESITLPGVEAIIINPGSVGQPRNGDEEVHAAYGILDTEKATFAFQRVLYDSKRMREMMYSYDLKLVHMLEGNHDGNPLRGTHSIWSAWKKHYQWDSEGEQWSPRTKNCT